MQNDSTAIQADSNLQGQSGALAHDSEHNDAGYRAAVVAGGALAVEGDPGESSPLLGPKRRGTSNAQGERTRSPPVWRRESEFEDLPGWRKPAVIWLLVPFLIYAICWGGTIVPLINLIKELLCREKLEARWSANPVGAFPVIRAGENNDVCNHDKEVQASVAMFTMYGGVLGGVLSAITCPKLGALSDRYGRLRLLAFSSCGSLLKDIVIVLIYNYPQYFSVWLLLGAYAVDGLCGSFSAGMAITHAYASDCTPPDQRATVFGQFHGCLFAGVALGPIIAGYIIEATGELVTMFYITLGCHLSYITFILLCVPESLSKKRQLEAREKKSKADDLYLASHSSGSSNPAAHVSFWLWFKRHNVFAPLKILYPTGPGSSPALRRNLLVLAAVDTTMFGTAIGAMTVTIIYTGYVFGWDTLQTSQFVSIVNISRVTCLVVVLPLLTRLVRGKLSDAKAKHQQQTESGCDGLDLALIRIAVAFDTLGFVGYALAKTGAMMTLSGIVASIGGIGSPTLQGSLTKHVPPDRTGQLLGAMGLLHALARVVAPTLFNYIYARTVVVDRPSVVFVVLASFFGLAFLVSLFLRKHVYYDAKAAQDFEDTEEEERTREEEVMALEREEEEALI